MFLTFLYCIMCICTGYILGHTSRILEVSKSKPEKRFWIILSIAFMIALFILIIIRFWII